MEITKPQLPNTPLDKTMLCDFCKFVVVYGKEGKGKEKAHQSLRPKTWNLPNINELSFEFLPPSSGY